MSPDYYNEEIFKHILSETELAFKAFNYAKQIAYSSEDTLWFTYKAALEMRFKQGVFVETGVAAGAQIIMMAAAAPEKVIYAFDSFQGIPLPSNRDDQYPGIRKISQEEQSQLPSPGEQVLETSGATAVSEETFWEHVNKAGVGTKNIKTVPGWFEHTTGLFGQMHTQIALLRLDGDLYNSTRVCLENLYPRVVKGGIVIVDDFDLQGSREALHDYLGCSIAFNYVNGLDSKDGIYFYKP
jgi:O-methyltransferase